MDDKKKHEEKDSLIKNIEQNNEVSQEKKSTGSGIFTADGKELPEIEGGYDLIGPGGTLGDDEFE